MSPGAAAGQPKALTLGQVVRAALPIFSQTHRLPDHHWKVLRAIAACHTPALGGHQYRCAHCGLEHFVPHSCGNRHCPSCQKLNGAHWLERQTQHLLPVPYFHLVFTLPHELNPLIQHNQRSLYSLLFSSATATLLEFGRNNLHATLGITAVLHTWGQNLGDHYHLHCVVTGGGLSLDGQSWAPCRPDWLFSVQALSVVFRAKFRDGLRRLFDQNQLQLPAAQTRLRDAAAFGRWLRRLCQKQWVVYAKRPFAGPRAVLAYLCRYTHRVAITDSRLESLNPQKATVTFGFKDYRHGAKSGSMTLGLAEFLRRFCLHVLPSGFVKIRHYGLLSNRDRPARIARARELLAQSSPQPHTSWQIDLTLKPVAAPPLVCPRCKQQTLVLIAIVQRPKSPVFSDSS
jgi:hypothetical protein